MGKTLCVIPARGGSKRIPRKNIVEFEGKPLIAHSIENALNSSIFDEVIVSTDDEEIASISRKFKAKIPFMRPKELSDDYAPTNAVISHAIKELASLGQDFETVCCLYATAPLIDSEILKQAYAEFKEKDCEFLSTACEFSYPIQRAFMLDKDKRITMFDESSYYERSQDLTPAFHDAGAFYFGKSQAWLEGKQAFKPHSRAFLLPRHLVCDIDSLEDLEFARLLFKFKNLGLR
ncbi:pseudaminic acid cytidylyltransferase [Campylobacter troglodytis]|uniref:pseudaminic acid cytidylyltransferase n=1 Tax=Campylobacter troglodytis TaxID=654363 RepID=UPI00115A9C92|nr:pseudaminic acid cytidylyltransferase [Campylobacter troglodytis]TQR59610.1 pseudaminic acid cytidylyltransferase [Campylobacter troglodytis]